MALCPFLRQLRPSSPSAKRESTSSQPSASASPEVRPGGLYRVNPGRGAGVNPGRGAGVVPMGSAPHGDHTVVTPDQHWIPAVAGLEVVLAVSQ